MLDKISVFITINELRFTLNEIFPHSHFRIPHYWRIAYPMKLPRSFHFLAMTMEKKWSFTPYIANFFVVFAVLNSI